MPHRRTPSTIARGKPPEKSPAALDTFSSLPVLRLSVLALAITAALLLYFFDAPPESLAQRQASLLFLLAPDHLFELWCGGKLAYFSLIDRWPIVLMAATILLTAWLAGRLLLLGLGVARLLDRLERFVFAIGAGLNLLSLYALAIGLAGGLQQPWLFIAPIALLVVANLRQFLLAGSKPAPGPPELTAPFEGANDPRWYWWLLAALPFALVIILGAMLPPWDYDVREYHLQAPKEWYENGRIDFLPHNIYANMPLGSELTGVWAMAIIGGKDGWWWGALTGKTVMACYSLVSAAALVAFGRRLHSAAAGAIAAVIYLCVPWTATLAMAGYNEGPVGLYALLAIFALWLPNQNRPQGESVRLIALAGLCAGSAVACKYPPLLFVVVPLTVWLLFRPSREGEAPAEPFPKRSIRLSRSFAIPAFALPASKRHFLQSAVFVAAVSAACGLWFAKNWALTNNPTYPLLYSMFDGRTRTPEKNRQWMTVHSPQPDQEGNRFSPRQFINQLTLNLWRTRLASLCIPPLAAMAWFARDKRRWLATMTCWLGFVFVAWWLTTHRLDRFLVLTLPLASLMAAVGALAIPHPAWRFSAVGFVGLTALIHFPFVTLQPDNRYFAPLDMLRRDDRELSLQGLRVESAHRWLNEHAQPGEKVLLLGDAEPFDLELPAVYNTCFDDCQFTRIFKGRTRAERLAALRQEQIAYVFCSWAHLARFRSEGNYGYTSDYPTPELVHNELVRDEKLLIPIEIEADPQSGELFRVADQ